MKHVTSCAAILVWLFTISTLADSIPAITALADTGFESNTIVVTATRTQKRPASLPFVISTISKNELRSEKMVRTVPEALKETPGVAVQKTTHGQGSPYIRGFTGLRTLFLIDGIRLNNSCFREGPNQYWNTVDPYTLEQLEVIKGPASVLYGSDAVGGTVNAITLQPDRNSGTYQYHGNVYYRGATAEQSNAGRLEMNLASPGRVSSVIGLSPKRYGNLVAGSETGLQKKTGYDELDGDVKLLFPAVNHGTFTLAHQTVRQDDIWRTHATNQGISWMGTSIGTDKEHSFDQARHLTYMKYQKSAISPALKTLSVRVSHQLQKETRFRIKKDNASDKQGFDVHTLGAGAQIDLHSKIGRFSCGTDLYRDIVQSFMQTYTAEGTLKSTEIQGPVADDASYDDAGFFLQDDVQLRENINLILGGRFSYFRVNARAIKSPVDGRRMSLYKDWSNVVGSVRGIVRCFKGDELTVFTGIAQGFRAPNLSDLTRFDIARSSELEVPALDLQPEKYVTSEIGIRSFLTGVHFQGAYFYTAINNMIIRTPTGNQFPDAANRPVYEVTKRNSGQGYIHGIESSAKRNLLKAIDVSIQHTWLMGELLTFPTSENVLVKEPLSQLMPQTVQGSIRLQLPNKPWWIESFCAASARQDNLSSRDRMDTQRIPPGGTRGYAVATVRAGYAIRSMAKISIGIENISDENYRIHGSGINEPGRNFIGTAEFRF